MPGEVSEPSRAPTRARQRVQRGAEGRQAQRIRAGEADREGEDQDCPDEELRVSTILRSICLQFSHILVLHYCMQCGANMTILAMYHFTNNVLYFYSYVATHRDIMVSDNMKWNGDMGATVDDT